MENKADKLLEDYGFKRLSLENFLDQDPVVGLFVQVDQQKNETVPTTPEFWAEIALNIGLSKNVPLEVRKQFEIARGLLVYAYYFYPFFTLSMELAMRVADSAIQHRCAQVNAPGNLRSFHDRVEWLQQAGYITKENCELWHVIREQRNYSFHSDRQMLVPPGMAIPLIDKLTEYIDNLFI